MSFALIAAVLSSISLSLMVVFDRLMMGDCYGKKPDRAWLVSSIAGATFGLFATGITWALYSVLSPAVLSDLFTQAINLFYPYGLLMVIAGAINSQVLRHYFRLFIPDKNNYVNETAIAMWLASIPIFLFLAIYVINLLPVDNSILDGLAEANVSIQFGIILALAVLSMLVFEYSGGGMESFRLTRLNEVGKLILTIVLYSLIISAILRSDMGGVETTLALQPYYWIGYLAALRLLVMKNQRADMLTSWPNIKLYIYVIIVAEVIGMLVFYFEFFALSDLDPSLVNLIIGAHMLFVFAFTLMFMRYGRYLDKQGIQSVSVFGARFSRREFPSENITVFRIVSFIAVIFLLILAISHS